jgi:polygalacturonase
MRKKQIIKQMKKEHYILLVILALSVILKAQAKNCKNFPDGTKIPAWFSKNNKTDIKKLGKQYIITDYNVLKDSNLLQTSAIQQIIDKASSQGGGVIIIPEGTYLTGALFFKPGTHLHVKEGGVLKGSDNIAHFPIMPSRMEGQNLDYFPAVINAYNVNGFTISGKGTINGNGLKYWEAFWQRRKENPKCTNLEVSRPRLVFIWNSNDVQLQDVRLINSGFWTTHFYKCNNVKMLDLYIYSPMSPVKAPSTDAIDIDVCNNFHVKGCYLSVNDDAIAIKGGKGPWADKDEDNGPNTNIIIEDCEFGFCHSAVTCGSESIHNRNIIFRNSKVENAQRLLWLKMRPDTPQKYEYICVDNITGNARSLLYIKPWTQFFDLQGRQDIPKSFGSHVTLKNIDFKCNVFYDVNASKDYDLSYFKFENLKIESSTPAFNPSIIKGVEVKKVKVNNVLLK